MKKIISLCSVVLVFALMITVITACGDNTEDNTTTTQDSENVAANTKGFTVEINETTAIVKKDGKEFQTLKFPVNVGMQFDLEYAKKNNAFIDMNFDGEPDLYIAISNVNGVINYYCWIYNATPNQFDYSVILSELKNISVDADNHRILSTVMIDGAEHVFSYRWVDGQLRFDTDFSEENGGIPEDVTQVVNDNAIGSDKKPDNETNKKPVKETNKKDDKEETTKKNSGSENKTTTKVNKPANTTTTAPNVNNGLVIETGSIDDGWF